ncbi:iron-containing alcohol dehydrogenase family protein [Halospeciosus flavus]|uniref:Iron-containing alcohol dehydrogenase family protein n=1 Tax=Halospeciosus flavus TaxID=3032283 RepID=A0ABD5Z0P3_9EURY|nr:iron-containing alcohol dehydrogenase family protein [Halospeciosus flavus]
MHEEFRFDYEPGTLVYGEGCVSALGDEVAAIGAEDALVVTGETVGTTPEVVDPVRAGLGDRLAGVFAETTTAKTLGTAIDAAERFHDLDADALVSLGGGSSLDVAKVASVLAARNGDDIDRAAVHEEFEETGTLSVPGGELVPILTVPTTLAGADLSVVAGITTRTDGLTRGGVSDGRLMPEALYYDPALFETTPHDVLCASAMNGFDKGVETLYAANATPVTDGTAMRGLRLLSKGLPALGAGERDEQTLHDAVVGTMLVQYGCSRGSGSTLSLIHAFGHGIARGYAVQQGGAHAIIAPHALRLLFDRVDGRRDLLAEALGVDDTDDPAGAVVDRVAEIRDALGLPTRLREIEDLSKEDLPDVAESTHDDSLVGNTPEGFDPSVEDIEDVLRSAW